MQRYHVNYKVLIAVLGGGVLLAAALFGIYTFQYNRGAEKLLVMADKAREEGELMKSANYLRRYVRIRPDDTPRATEMAMAYAEVAEMKEAEPRDRFGAINMVESELRKQRENTALRRRLVDLLIELRDYKKAADHLEIMVRDEPKNAELLTKLVDCYLKTQQYDKGLKLCSRLVGYDPVNGDFSADAQAIAPTEVEAYGQLATLLARRDVDREEIAEVIERAVEVNPESAQAYVIRGRYLLGQGEERKEDAIADIEKAMQLDPKNSDALLLRARLYGQEEEYDQALALIEQGLEAEPDNGQLYLTGASIAHSKDGVDAALEWFRKGAQATEGGVQLNIKVYQARSLINANKLDEAQEVIEEFNELPNFPKSLLEYLKALVMVSEYKWYNAAQALDKLRPEMSSDLSFSEELNAMLALCYTRLEQWELAEAAAARTLQVNPMNKMAQDFLTNAQRKRGQAPERAGSQDINQLVAKEMSKPAEEQDWDSVAAQTADYCDKLIDEGTMQESSKMLLLAEIRLRAKDYKQAASLVRKAITADPENINTWRLACRLTAADPDGGAVKGLQMLDKVVEKFGDKPLLRLDRADMYMTLNDEDVINQMLSITEGVDDMSVQERVMLWKGLASRFESLRASEALATARSKIAELAPDELPNLLDIFLAARAENDDAQMADAQKRILDVVGSKENPSWLYTEAHRLISLHQRGLAGDEALSEAEQLVKRAQQQRSEWHLLNLLLADLALQRGNEAEALTNLDRGAELGPPTAASLLRHVSLLMKRGRYDDARLQMERAAPAFRERLLSRQYAESLLYSRYQGEGDKKWEQAVDVARNAGQLAPENGELQLWLGRFLLRAAMTSKLAESTRTQAIEDAGDGFQKAVELMPKSQEAWLAYISYLAQASRLAAGEASSDDDSLTIDGSRVAEAREAVRQMQLSLDEDNLAIALGAAYEMLGRWFDARNIYTRALEQNPDDPRVMRRLASLYLGKSYPLDDKQVKATPLINNILKQAVDNPELAGDDNVLWARRTAAKLLAQTGDYQKALEAEKLLRSNLVGGELTLEDKLLMAKILATRPEPPSKLKAASLFENIQQTQDLGPIDRLTLGQIYFATAQWEKCQQLMIELISQYPTFVPARDAYIRMLLSHDEGRDLADAARQLKRLQEYAPTEPSTLELLVRISSKLGRKQEVLPVLRNLLAKEENRRNPEVIVRVANLLADLDDLDNAEKLFRAAAKMNPRFNLALASFLGQHRDMGDALDLLEASQEQVGEVQALVFANETLKKHADNLEEEHVKRVEGWLNRALREDPESIRLLMQQAQLHDIKKEYDQAAAIYRDLLKRDDLVGLQRAVALNNIAYQLAMSSSDEATFEEAIGYVAEAADILGPQSDILDTRAVVFMALGQYDAAVADMELAVTDNPTASKYFHLAQALMLDKQQQKSIAAWDKAVELGLTIDDVGTAERDAYRDLEARISRLKSTAGA